MAQNVSQVVQDILLRGVIWRGQSKLLGGGGEAIGSKQFVCLTAKSAYKAPALPVNML